MRALLSLARLWPPAALPGTPRCTGGALHAEAAFIGVGRRIRGMIDLRVELRAIRRCCPTAEGRACTYGIAAHRAGV